jgi:uncharacterized protein (DUF1800 family)
MALLNEHNQPLDKRLTKHLLRRACFQYSKAQLDAMTGKTPAEILAQLNISKSYAWNWPNDPVTNGSGANISCANNQDGFWLNDANWKNNSYTCRQGPKRALVAGWWWYNTIKQNTLVDKLTWFLFTTFTASKDDGSGKSAHYFDYLNLLQFYADKSVKDLARKITFDNSMLYYLDNGDNNNNSPNENYAREFLELFTIGKGPQVSDGDYTNYTEHDVVQAAKVFSGIKLKANRDTFDSDTAKSPHFPSGIPMGYINVNKHDTGNKTFSYAFENQTISGGNSSSAIHTELDDFVDMVFDQLETAKNYVRKMYRMFVRSEWEQEVEDDIITPLAHQLKNNGYNLLDVLQTLLKSKHFFDLDDSDSSNENIGGIIKSPLQFINELLTILDVKIPNPETPQVAEGTSQNNAKSNENYRFYMFWWNFCHNTFFSYSGMNIFSPATVAGYPADYQPPAYDKAWFNSNNIIDRYNTILSFIGGTYSSDNYGNGQNKIQGIQTTNNGYQYYARIWTDFDATNFIENIVSDPYDATKIVQQLSELFYSEDLDASRTAYFVKFLIQDNEPNYVWYYAWEAYKTTSGSTQEDAAIFIKNRLSGQEGLLPKMINAAEFQLM